MSIRPVPLDEIRAATDPRVESGAPRAAEPPPMDEPPRDAANPGVVLIGVDLSFDDLFVFALKGVVALALALFCVGIVVGLPLLLVIQATR